MLARLTVWIFYAVVFFLLGSWSATHSTGLRDALGKGVDYGWRGIQRVQTWAVGTISAPTSAPNSAAPSVRSVDQVTAARAAFARGDITIAINIYQQHLKQAPDDVDARGELGNVLFSSGRLPEAADAFNETALKLIDRGETDKARQLLPAIRRGNPALAAQLDARLRKSASGQ